MTVMHSFGSNIEKLYNTVTTNNSREKNEEKKSAATTTYHKQPDQYYATGAFVSFIETYEAK